MLTFHFFNKGNYKNYGFEENDYERVIKEKNDNLPVTVEF